MGLAAQIDAIRLAIAIALSGDEQAAAAQSDEGSPTS
jgi:pyroglutamyl-peptidase